MLGRRDLLRGLGAGAAVAALAPLGCGHAQRRVVDNLEARPGELREVLRQAVTVLGARLDQPRAWMLWRRRVRVLIDVAVAEVVEEQVAVVVLSGRDGKGRRVERCFDDVTRGRIAAVADELAARGAARRGAAIPAPVDHGVGPGDTIDADPTRLAQADWLARARDVSRRVERAASSRIVYRAAWLTTDDDGVWVVGEDGDRHQRLVRSRIGATFAAWQGSRPQFGEVEIAGGFGPAVDRLDDDAITRAAADALALFTPSPPPQGRQVVLLDPAVVAALIDVHARLGAGPLPARTPLAIVDDPTVPGFARFWFDDDGTAARVVPLAGDGGAVGGAVGGDGAAAPVAPGPPLARRSEDVGWRLVAAPSQLVAAPGARGVVELEGGIDDGLVIEGVRDVHVDDAGVLVVRVGRGRQLAAGVRTGRQWGDLEVRGPVAELLADAMDVSQERRERVVAGRPARSVTAPWLLTRAHVGQARERT